MRRYLTIVTIILVCISISGCTNFGKSPSTTVTPTQPIIAQKYTMGDIVKKSTIDDTGKIVLSYDSSRNGYIVRPIIIDSYGRVYYLDSDNNQQITKADLENNYLVKVGNIDNPYGLSIFKPIKKPKYNPGDIVIDEDYPIEGILILKFDYFDDSYIYCNSYLTSGKWTYDTTAQHKEGRVSLEGQYDKKLQMQ